MSKLSKQQRQTQAAAGKVMRKFFFNQMLLSKNLNTLTQEAQKKGFDFFKPGGAREMSPQGLEKELQEAGVPPAEIRAHLLARANDTGGKESSCNRTQWTNALTEFRNNPKQNAGKFLQLLQNYNGDKSLYFVGEAAFPHVANVFNAELTVNFKDLQTNNYKPQQPGSHSNKLKITQSGNHYGGENTLDNGDCFFISLLEDKENFLAVMAAAGKAGMSGEDQGKLLAAHNVYRKLNNLDTVTLHAAIADSDIPPEMDDVVAGQPGQHEARSCESKSEEQRRQRQQHEQNLLVTEICSQFATLAQQNEAVETPQHRGCSDSNSASSTSFIVERDVTPARSPRIVHNLLPGAPSTSQRTSARIETESGADEYSDSKQTGEAKIIISTERTRAGKKRPTKVSAPEKLITAETAAAMITYLVAKGVKTVTISKQYSDIVQEFLRDAVNNNPAIKLEDQSSTNQTPQLSH